MYDDGYVPPILTTDSVIFQQTDLELSVLLIKRAQDPFRGSWALPGGYIASGETTTDAMLRILDTKAGIVSSNLNLIEQLYTFDTVSRDPRGHAVSVTYMGLAFNLTLVQKPDLQTPQFFSLSQLPELAYDHNAIIEYAHDRLKSKLEYTNAVYALMPEMFTLSQLQATYEAVLCHTLDKRNFRKKFLTFELIEETNELLRKGAHRPAKLYRFKQRQLQSLSVDFG